MNLPQLKQQPAKLGKEICATLASRYHTDEPRVQQAVRDDAPEQFLRLFLITHGMPPVGNWSSHTYAKFTNSESGKQHFFLIPLPSRVQSQLRKEGRPVPKIRMIEGRVWIDEFAVPIFAQSIPFTNRDWYFHYNPNRENQQFLSSTLNLSPKCPEKCTLCAGARTGRVNNGKELTMDPAAVAKEIAGKYPEAVDQLDILAIVTGCFDSFDTLHGHLKNVKASVDTHFSPSQYRVLEHNINSTEQFDKVVGELGFEVYVTLECFDDKMRFKALNGRMGRKGRPSSEFIDIIRTYANYIEDNPQLDKRYVRVTYIMGIDSLEKTEEFFKIIDDMNKELKTTKILPWLSVFTPYDNLMKVLQRKDFSFTFLLESQDLCRQYFGNDLMEQESGGTADGYARGLF